MQEKYVELNWEGESNGFKFSIKSVGVKPANQFEHHPNNPKFHPMKQRKAVESSLKKYGWAGLVIENIETGHVLDGHERIWNAMARGEETLVPYLLLSIPEDKEDEFLVIFDHVGNMAEWDISKLKDMKDRGVIENISKEFDVTSVLDRIRDVKPPTPEKKVERDESEKAYVMYFRFDSIDEFKRIHKLVTGYNFDGEGNSVLLDGKDLGALL